MAQRSPANADYGLSHDHQDGWCDCGEYVGDDGGIAGADVERRQREKGNHSGQYEQGPGDQAADHPVEEPSDVDGQLLSLWSREQGAEGQGVEEPLLTDPSFLVDESVLHHGDLPGGAAEGLQRDGEPGTRRLTEGD